MSNVSAVVIGGSAGGVEALSEILPVLPRDFPIPVVIVVHLSSHRKSLLAEIFQSKCAMRVKEAEDSELAEPATAYLAPPNYHLLVEPDHRLSLSVDDPVLFSRPSIDVLFESASHAYGEDLLGVVLSGASSDGAAGLRHIVDRGGKGIVQAPRSASSPMMPQSALNICPEAECLGPKEIAARLLTLRAREAV